MLTVELDSDEEELLLFAEKVPDSNRRRVILRPDAFRRLTGLGIAGPAAFALQKSSFDTQSFACLRTSTEI